MYRASAYGKSQETLLEFASKFNSIEVYPNLYCCPIIKETMLNDGCFVDVGLGKLVAFDWEIRTRLKSFKPGEFKYAFAGTVRSSKASSSIPAKECVWSKMSSATSR